MNDYFDDYCTIWHCVASIHCHCRSIIPLPSTKHSICPNCLNNFDLLRCDLNREFLPATDDNNIVIEIDGVFCCCCFEPIERFIALKSEEPLCRLIGRWQYEGMHTPKGEWVLSVHGNMMAMLRLTKVVARVGCFDWVGRPRSGTHTHRSTTVWMSHYVIHICIST